MLCFPNCKINLGLYITGRRSDGYHNIETVFYPLPVNDVLEIVPSFTAAAEGRPADAVLHASGLPVSGDAADNLVWKAYSLLRVNQPDKIQPVNIYLHKAIPMGAGLGGGSADGAYMLRLLNDYFRLGYDKEHLAALALQLGSDCPFFIYNMPKFAAGRGEQMSDVAIDLQACSIQVVCPAVHVSTSAAFQMIRPAPAPFDLRMLGGLAVEAWKDHISNDFEEPVFRLHPVLGEIKRQLYAGGAVYAAMTGSGSALYGLFEKGKSAVVKADVVFKEFYVE